MEISHHLQITLGITVEFARPKAVLKACYDAKIIAQEEFDICIDLIEDRNLTSHGYNEDLAEEISKHIPQYFRIMMQILERLKSVS